jgi:hypothetical protein
MTEESLDATVPGFRRPAAARDPVSERLHPGL